MAFCLWAVFLKFGHNWEEISLNLLLDSLDFYSTLPLVILTRQLFILFTGIPPRTHKEVFNLPLVLQLFRPPGAKVFLPNFSLRQPQQQRSKKYPQYKPSRASRWLRAALAGPCKLDLLTFVPPNPEGAEAARTTPNWARHNPTVSLLLSPSSTHTEWGLTGALGRRNVCTKVMAQEEDKKPQNKWIWKISYSNVSPKVFLQEYIKFI